MAAKHGQCHQKMVTHRHSSFIDTNLDDYMLHTFINVTHILFYDRSLDVIMMNWPTSMINNPRKGNPNTQIEYSTMSFSM